MAIQKKKEVGMSIVSGFLDLLPLKLCGEEGHPQRPNMQRGHGNPRQAICQGA